MTPDDAAALQRAYRDRRREWAACVGRPYSDETEDLRPPPGEIEDDGEVVE